MERIEPLAESEARFRAMADHAPVLLWMSDTTGMCTFFNQRWLQFTGRTMAQELGNGWAEGVHPEDFQRCMHIYFDAFVQRASFEMEYRLRREDGDYRRIYDLGVPNIDSDGTFLGYIGSCIDITAQHEAREAQRRVSDQIRLTFEAAPTGMIMIDDQGRIVMLNSAVERLLGYERSELTGQPLEGLIPERFRNTHRSHRLGFLDSPVARPMGGGRDLFARRRDGTEVAVEIGLSPLKTPEGTFVISSVVDITARKKAEEEREALLEELRDGVKEREALLREIHHRVKNNLQVVASLINMQARRSDDASRGALNEFRTRIETIALIHEELYQSGTYANVPFPDYARSLAQNVLRATQSSPNVTLDLDVEEIFLPMEQAIPCGLILNELVTNALKHAFPNERSGRIEVAVRRESDRRIRLSVADDGVGLIGRQTLQEANAVGWNLVRAFADQLDAEVGIDGAGGMRVSVRFEGQEAKRSD